MSNEKSRWCSWLTLLAAALVFASAPLPAQTLQSIKQKHVLSVGVKADSKPWGYVDEQGRSIGWEIDLAKEIARRLGVPAELVVVTSANRIQLLEQGRIDLIVATMTDTEARRKVVTMIEPPYFSDGTNVLARKDAGIRTWDDLRGKRLCGVNGSIYNRTLQQKYGAEMVTFAGLAEAQAAMMAGNCVGIGYSANILALLLADHKELQADYAISLSSIDEEPWAMAIRLQDRGSEFHKFLQDTLRDFHRTGYLISTLKKWGFERPPELLIKLNKQLGG